MVLLAVLGYLGFVFILIGLMGFAENLKLCRTEKGFSQEDLAKRIGVHSNHLSRYERGISSPSIEVVQKIAEVLDVSMDQLVYGKQSNIEGAISDRELIALFKKVQLLPNKQKDTVKDFLSAFILKADLKDKLS